MNENIKNKKACITGASSGIGEEFSYRLAEKGYDLILVARSEDKLQRIKDEIEKRTSVNVEVKLADLSKRESCFSLAENLKKADIDVLINNAGFGNLGEFCEVDKKKDLSMIDVNVVAMQILCGAMLPVFVERDSGYILNVASIAGLLNGGPYMATYYATKAYVVSFTSSLSKELRDRHSRVKISALCPGPVNTNFNDTAGVSFALKGMSAAKCVANCLNGMSRSKLIIVPSIGLSLGMALCRAIPRQVQLFFVAKAQKKKSTNKITERNQ